MACYFPWEYTVNGAQKLMQCGRCHGCRLEYSRQWAVRCVHEASLYDFNVFITLTYKTLPVPCERCDEPFDAGSLHYCDYQLFMKRLRIKRPGVRFYMCGEYGDENGRPHYHAILFNCWFPDMTYWRKSESGFKLYRSKELEELWSLGDCEIGMVSFESAAYVARYVMKKMSGDGCGRVAQIIDPDSLVVVRRVKPFAQMSRKPGIGSPWLKKFYSDVYPSGKVVVNGAEVRAPKFYDKIARGRGLGEYFKLSDSRSEVGRAYAGELLPGRLEPRSQVADARASLFKRDAG